MDEKRRAGPTLGLPQLREDARVAQEVTRALARSGRFPPGHLHVSSFEGVVKLRGRVASYYQKQLAQATASAVIGGRQLVNEVEVS
jgi:osmotically-inducible protein OsmY